MLHKKDLLALHQTLCDIHHFDREAIRLQRTGLISTYPSTQGQEAVFLGAAAGISSEDVYIPYYRDTAALYWRGVSFYHLFRFWGGYSDGMSYPNNPNDYPICITISTQISHAVGVAMAYKHQNKKAIILVTMGDGATNKGQFFEGINMALTHRLPILFFINNNQWAISTPLKQQGLLPPLDKAKGLGLNGEDIDGYDLLAVKECVQHAKQHILERQLPYCIQATTYRTCDHTTADDAKRYQPKSERLAYIDHDPLTFFEQKLISQGILSTQTIKQHHTLAKQTIANASQQYQTSTYS